MQKKTIGYYLHTYRYICAIIVFVSLLIMGVHGLSLPVWDQYFSADITTQYLGTLRNITSDVWACTIPQVMSQAANDFPLYNYDIAFDGLNAMIAHIPSKDITLAVGQMPYWGFLFFDINTGVAWFYWFRIIGLFMTSYDILCYLSHKRKLSVCGALLIAFAPATMWWGGHALPETLLYAQMLIVSWITYIRNPNKWSIKIISLLIAISSSIGFVTLLQPSLQVSVGIIVLIFICWIPIEQRKKNPFVKKDYIVIALSLSIVFGLLGRVFWLSKDSIYAITQTVFPGSRFVQGGSATGLHLFYSIFQMFLPFQEAIGTNNCEASSFMPVWLFVLFMIPLCLSKIKECKHKGLIWVLYGYFCFCFSWLLIQYPAWFAKITLFSNVTDGRLFWALGALSVYLICYVLAQGVQMISNLTASVLSALFGIIVIFLVQRGGFYVAFLEGHNIYYWIAIAFMIVLSFSIFANKTRCFMFVSVIYSMICIFAVNPLCFGVEAITEKQVYNTITQIEQSDPDSTWFFNNGYPYPNYLLTAGCKVIGATNFYEDETKWATLDPTGEFEEVYNRYAHVSTYLGETTSFSVVSPDLIEITLSPEDLAKLYCDYVLSFEDLATFSAMHGNFLEEIERSGGVIFYKVVKVN